MTFETSPAHILVVEDDANLASGLDEALSGEGYHTTRVADGAEGLSEILTDAYDLVILDVMLPSMEGIDVCKQARKAGSDTPILFLTVKGSSADRIEGMAAGGDDYLTKPFHLDELLLRVRSILKRWSWYKSHSVRNVMRFGDNEIDFAKFKATSWDGRSHDLAEKEAMILKVLSERENEVISREDLLEHVWGFEALPSTRTVDNFMFRLRKKFEPDPDNPRYLHTARGVGYRFTAQAEPSQTSASTSSETAKAKP